MARYIILTNQNNFYKIAASDELKDYFMNIPESYISKTMSETDFMEVKTEQKNVNTVSGDTVTYFSCMGVPDMPTTLTKEQLQSYVNDHVRPVLDNVIENQPNHPLINDINTYNNYLTSLNFDSLSYPINGTWEKYCYDNNITFVSLSEI
jgi:hypothetical protein